MNLCALRYFSIDGTESLARTYSKCEPYAKVLWINFIYYDKGEPEKFDQTKIEGGRYPFSASAKNCKNKKYVILESRSIS